MGKMELKILRNFKAFDKIQKRAALQQTGTGTGATPTPTPNPNASTTPSQKGNPNKNPSMDKSRYLNRQMMGDSFGDGLPMAEFSFAKQTILYMRSNNHLGDVLLEVGPPGRSEEIRTFKFCLMAASPIFRQLFMERWERTKGLDDGSEIVKLPNVEATAFKNFLSVLLTHEMTPEILATYSLTLNDIFDIMAICRKYVVAEMDEICQDYLRRNKTIENCIFIYENVEGLVNNKVEQETLNFIVEHFNQLVERDEFLQMNKKTLLRVLRHNRLHMAELGVFKSVYTWAKFQCVAQGLECTGPNMRQVIGEVLFLIRFPLISPRNFSVCVRSKNILHQQEALDLLTYMSLSPEDKKTVNLDYLRFRTHKRQREATQTMQFYTNVQIDYETNPVICIANEKSARLRCDTSCKGIRIYSFGFAGPMENETSYKAKVTLYSEQWNSLGTLSTTIVAKGKTVFHVWLRTPKNLEPNTWYFVNYQLEGGDTGSVPYQNGEPVLMCNDDEVAFTLQQEFQDLQLVEIKYEKLKQDAEHEDEEGPLEIVGEFTKEDAVCIQNDDGESQTQGEGEKEQGSEKTGNPDGAENGSALGNSVEENDDRRSYD